MARMDDMSFADALVPLLKDSDAEIKAQAAKWIGDIKYGKAGSELIAGLKDQNPRVRFFFSRSLGKDCECGCYSAFDHTFGRKQG